MSHINKSLIAGAVFLLFWGGLAAYTAGLPHGDRNVGISYDPLFFPSVLIFLGMALSLILIVTEARAIGSGASDTQDNKRVVVLVGLIGLFFAAMPFVGFLLSSAVFIVVFTWVLGYRRKLVIAAMAVLGPLVVWYVFTVGLKAPLAAFPAI